MGKASSRDSVPQEISPRMAQLLQLQEQAADMKPGCFWQVPFCFWEQVCCLPDFTDEYKLFHYHSIFGRRLLSFLESGLLSFCLP